MDFFRQLPKNKGKIYKTEGQKKTMNIFSGQKKQDRLNVIL
ncbi:MAG: hypothetical protein JWP12_2567 [Bacteroidetes bacterium]|nr:hypothetical protein [Bacteroidota bacterium]